jgi:hypothetical protein|tara:strand:- start:24 stop:179 length:156 start_codon:yes stop_codon:yes gene_type:complete
MADEMIFWDDMWNQSSTDPKRINTKTSSECCGNWDKEGKCNCKNKNNENTN